MTENQGQRPRISVRPPQKLRPQASGGVYGPAPRATQALSEDGMHAERRAAGGVSRSHVCLKVASGEISTIDHEQCVIAADGGTSVRGRAGPSGSGASVFGHQTGARYSLMEYVVAPRPPTEAPDFGPHRHHRRSRRPSSLRRGRLRFSAGRGPVFDLGAVAIFVPGPAGCAPSASRTCRREAVELLVSFHPGGFETLFITHADRTSDPPPSPHRVHGRRASADSPPSSKAPPCAGCACTAAATAP